MLTTDLALRFDPVYEPISRRFLEHPDEFADAFARAWFKLTHRDMGPDRALPRPGGPDRDAAVAGPASPRSTHELDRRRRTSPPSRARSSPRGCRSPSWSPPRGRRPRRSAAATSAAAPTGRASASSRRAAGRSTTPTSWRRCCAPWRGSRQAFNAAQTGGKQVSLADLIVLGGVRGRRAGRQERRPRRRGRRSRRAARTRRRSRPTWSPSPRSSRPRTGSATTSGRATGCRPSTCCVDRANLLTLSAPEMTVLVGGLRVLGANYQQSSLGRLHRDARVADQRLLREPARPGHDVEADVRGRGDLRGPRRRHRRGQVDRQPRRPRLRLELRAAGARGGLRERRRAGEVRRTTSSRRGSR